MLVISLVFVVGPCSYSGIATRHSKINSSSDEMMLGSSFRAATAAASKH